MVNEINFNLAVYTQAKEDNLLSSQFDISSEDWMKYIYIVSEKYPGSEIRESGLFKLIDQLRSFYRYRPRNEDLEGFLDDINAWYGFSDLENWREHFNKHSKEFVKVLLDGFRLANLNYHYFALYIREIKDHAIDECVLNKNVMVNLNHWVECLQKKLPSLSSMTIDEFGGVFMFQYMIGFLKNIKLPENCKMISIPTLCEIMVKSKDDFMLWTEEQVESCVKRMIQAFKEALCGIEWIDIVNEKKYNEQCQYLGLNEWYNTHLKILPEYSTNRKLHTYVDGSTELSVIETILPHIKDMEALSGSSIEEQAAELRNNETSDSTPKEEDTNEPNPKIRKRAERKLRKQSEICKNKIRKNRI